LVALKLEGKNRADLVEEMVVRLANDSDEANANAVVWAGVRFPLPSSAEKQLKEWRTQWPDTGKETALDSRVRGALTLRLGDYVEAEKHLRSWLENDSHRRDSTAQLLLVITLAKQSRQEEARRELTQIQEANEAHRINGTTMNANPSAWLDEIEFSILLLEAEELLK